ncbi:transposase [Okeania sp. SIO2C9]|uniref:transposase n=1 Tax=Okeania sp. SIO2C9 TaxID=2607791 RepID=UPI0025E25C0B|nr:transposase [Okeania sp. SIO2C9]
MRPRDDDSSLAERAPSKRDVIGVDVGINSLATCSDGTTYANVKAYKQAQKRLTRYQRHVNKKEPGLLRNATQTKNRAKAVKKLASSHKKVADIRADTLHKLTTWASFKPQHHSN